jgi:hypothetical protein
VEAAVPARSDADSASVNGAGGDHDDNRCEESV